MKIVQFTHKGAREVNQDYLLHRAIGNDAHLFVVADGMGGYTAGDIAAKSVSESIDEYVEAHYSEMSPEVVLQNAVVFANEELSFRRYSYGGVQMGAVIVVMLLVDTTAYVTWLGDSRLYQYRNGKILFQSTDHSLVNDIRKIRFLKPQEIERYTNVVTRCVMGDDKLGTIDIQKLSVEPNDVIFMCTDGIHKTIDPMDLPTQESDLLTLLSANPDKFDDNYSLFRITI